MTYEKECQFGREIAASEVAACAATGNYPKLIRSIRGMSSKSDGVSIGYLQAIAEEATRQYRKSNQQ